MLVDTLRNVRDLLAQPGRWTQGTRACNRWGVAVEFDSPTAHCWCLMGAIAKLSPDFGEAIVVTRAIETCLPDGFKTIVRFNDDRDTTQFEVVMVLDKTIARETRL